MILNSPTSNIYRKLFLIHSKNAQLPEICLPLEKKEQNGEKGEKSMRKKDSLIQQKPDTLSVPASSSSSFTYNTAVQGNNLGNILVLIIL